MTNLFSRVKVLCVLVLMGVGLAAYSATPTVTSLTAQQRYPQNGLVDITMTLQCAAEDVANAECQFAATNGTTKAAIPITRITHNGTDTYADGVWIRRFVWDAKADVGAVKIDDVALTVDVRAALIGVQLWEDGPFWAECNVGAIKPEESGYYFLVGRYGGRGDDSSKRGCREGYGRGLTYHEDDCNKGCEGENCQQGRGHHRVLECACGGWKRSC